MLGSQIVKALGVACLFTFASVPTASAHHGSHHDYPGAHTKPYHKPSHGHHKPGHHKPGHHKPGYGNNRPTVVVKPTIVKPVVVKPHKHKRRYKHRRDLPERAVLSVLAGVSYAIIDNIYYRRNGSEYIYDPHPPRRH